MKWAWMRSWWVLGRTAPRLRAAAAPPPPAPAQAVPSPADCPYPLCLARCAAPTTVALQNQARRQVDALFDESEEVGKDSGQTFLLLAGLLPAADG